MSQLVRLDFTDAQFVDVVHTNGEALGMLNELDYKRSKVTKKIVRPCFFRFWFNGSIWSFGFLSERR
jgi:hypothetical protein